MKSAEPIIYLLKMYRAIISPHLPRVCRFHPSCSSYAVTALEQHGLIRGSLLSARRLLRCRPFGGWGYDPVPRPERDRSSLGY